MVKSSAFTFGMLLTIYLAGLGLGAALASLAAAHRAPAGARVPAPAGVRRALRRSDRPRPDAMASDAFRRSHRCWAYFSSYEPFDAAAAAASFWSGDGDPSRREQFIRLYLLLPAILIGPPTIAMGASFPLLQRIAVSDSRAHRTPRRHGAARQHRRQHARRDPHGLGRTDLRRVRRLAEDRWPRSARCSGARDRRASRSGRRRWTVPVSRRQPRSHRSRSRSLLPSEPPALGAPARHVGRSAWWSARMRRASRS